MKCYDGYISSSLCMAASHTTRHSHQPTDMTHFTSAKASSCNTVSRGMVSCDMVPEREEHNEPLQGLPATFNIDGTDMTFGPYLPARSATEAYCRSVGITLPFLKVYQTLNILRSKAVAQLYDEMKHAPEDPLVIASYQALCDETRAQWQFIKRTGL